ncbi:hypothetical protein EVAR_98082_1 [Eumeta japonica]|uniref:Uncharacterized protein n=1 Tax=Eumeta variegata TaxID=151549 RepID=A0A4C1WBX3_EUMVA|nr:hypothetical protein EVAR_98082_1 [Eumeta japonica]
MAAPRAREPAGRKPRASGGITRIIRLWLAFPDETSSFITVHNFFNEFKHGRTNLTDDRCEGCSSTAMTEDDISGVRLVIEADKRATYQQIRTSLAIGMMPYGSS